MEKSFTMRLYLNTLPKLNLKMKLTILLIFFSLFKIQAESYSQNAKITLDLQSVEIIKVLETIESLSEFKFLTNEKLIDRTRLVSINVKNKRIYKILDELFANQGITYKVIDRQIILAKYDLKNQAVKRIIPQALKQQNQEKQINGTVKDDEGNLLPGVSVIILGTTVGAQTNFDGKYSIKTSVGEVLQFSFLGLKTKLVTVGESNTIDVTLETDADALDEIVVTALGIQRDKKELGYSIETISGDELQLARDPNAVNSLQGKVSGVLVQQTAGGVGSANRVVIRGNNSLLGQNQPLYVVDGLPIDNTESSGGVDEWGNGFSIGNGIGDINPDDIQDITVLKGANAAALYGSRASNGVILITTKKGKSGQLSVSLNSSVTFDNAAYLPNFQNEYGQGSNGQISTTDPAVLRTSNSWGPRLDGSNQLLWTGETGPYNANPDNVKDFFNVGTTLVNSIAIDGGSENFSSRVGYTRADISGIVPNNDLTRNTFSVYSKLKYNSKLSIEGKINYVDQKVSNRPYLSFWPDNVVNSLYSMPRNVSLVDLEANQSIAPSGGGTLNNSFNSINTVGTTDKRSRVFGYTKLDYRFTNNLRAFFRAGTDYTTQKFLAWNPIDHPTVNGGRVTDNTYTNQQTNIDFLLTYSKDITDDMGFVLSGGGNALVVNSTISGGVGNGLINPGIYNVTNTSSYVVNPSTGLYRRKVNSLYGTADFSYKNYLFLQFTARNDWSSVLPEQSNSFFYPSVSLSTILTDMFNIESDVLKYWKFRASWAKVGSDGDVPIFSIHNRYLSSAQYLGNGTLTTPAVKPNANIVPQTTFSTEIGSDIRLFNDKLSIDFSYYNTKTENQIIQLPAPVEAGYTAFLLNEGTLTNKGVELGIDYKILDNEDFKWELGINYASNRARVSDLSTDLIPLAPISGSTPFRIVAYNNGEYGAIEGLGYRRNEAGQILVGDNGVPLTSTEQKNFGNFNPDWMGGITSTFSYKNVSLGFLISGRFGGQILSRTDMILANSGNSVSTLEHRSDFVVPNSITESTGSANTVEITPQQFYGATAGGSNIEDYVFDADYIKLKELSISYSLSESITDKLNISGASISFIARNLFFISREVDSFDPEVSGFNSRNAQGVELLSLPGTRSYGINLAVKF